MAGAVPVFRECVETNVWGMGVYQADAWSWTALKSKCPTSAEAKLTVYKYSVHVEEGKPK